MPSRLPVRERSLVLGLFGNRGSGKSAAMARMATKQWQRGRKIIFTPPDYKFDPLNLPLRFRRARPRKPLIPPEPITVEQLDRIATSKTGAAQVQGALILIDELQIFLARQRSMTIASFSLRAFFQQIRKRGVDLIFTTNSPSQLEYSVEEQTDFHAWCKLREDQRCIRQPRSRSGVRYHLDDCRDMVTATWVDSHMKFGAAPMNEWHGARDRRKRIKERMLVSPFYHVYNTDAVADVADTLSLTKARILERHGEDGLADEAGKVGLSTSELGDIFRDQIIPKLVADGATSIRPKAFLDAMHGNLWLKGEGGLKPLDGLSPESLGHVLGRLGLRHGRLSNSYVWYLPKREALELWQRGLWAPGDQVGAAD